MIYNKIKELNISMELNSLEAIKTAVSLNLGVAFVSSLALKNEIELKKTLQDILIHKKLSKYRKYNNYLKKIFFDDNKLAANKFNNIISKI
jgi:hypothetical protein